MSTTHRVAWTLGWAPYEVGGGEGVLGILDGELVFSYEADVEIPVLGGPADLTGLSVTPSGDVALVTTPEACVLLAVDAASQAVTPLWSVPHAQGSEDLPRAVAVTDVEFGHEAVLSYPDRVEWLFVSRHGSYSRQSRGIGGVEQAVRTPSGYRLTRRKRVFQVRGRGLVPDPSFARSAFVEQLENGEVAALVDVAEGTRTLYSSHEGVRTGWVDKHIDGVKQVRGSAPARLLYRVGNGLESETEAFRPSTQPQPDVEGDLYDVFVSYRSTQYRAALDLVDFLRERRLSVWLDRERALMDFRDSIDIGISTSRYFAVVWGPDSGEALRPAQDARVGVSQMDQWHEVEKILNHAARRSHKRVSAYMLEGVSGSRVAPFPPLPSAHEMGARANVDFSSSHDILWQVQPDSSRSATSLEQYADLIADLVAHERRP